MKKNENKTVISPFHLAFPVHDLASAREFYGGVLRCPEGRSAERWVDFNLYEHQIVAHLVEGTAAHIADTAVDGREVPIPHFGVILTMDQWHVLATRVRAAGVVFVIEPYIRFEGQPGEQATMFFCDPSGNALEFKAFANRDQIFAR